MVDVFKTAAAICGGFMLLWFSVFAVLGWVLTSLKSQIMGPQVTLKDRLVTCLIVLVTVCYWTWLATSDVLCL